MRIFAFGCSLTQYFYPTWADILISHFSNTDNALGYNWGKSGAGNQYIATKIWEANAIYNFGPDDLILIQWTSMFREDRYHEDIGWYCPGGFNEQRLKNKSFELNGFDYEDQMQWADYLHCVMRDCALISSTHEALKNLGCSFCTTGFRHFNEGFELYDELQDETLLMYENIGAILEKYKKSITLSIPPILNALDFGLDDKFFLSRPRSIPSLEKAYSHLELPETHPLPHEHMKFVEKTVLPYLGITKISKKTKNFVHTFIDQTIDKELIILKDLDWANTYQMGFSDDGRRP